MTRDDGYDFVTLTLTDQYGDPYAGQEVYLGSRSNPLSGGYTLGDIAEVSSEDDDYSNRITPEGKATLKITGKARGEDSFNIMGEKYSGSGTYRTLGKVSVDVSSSTSVSKYEFVAANSNSKNFTLDRNVFEDKTELQLYAMGYTSSGYSAGAFNEFESDDVKSGNEKLFTVEESAGRITVKLAEEDSNGDQVYNTGSAQLRATVKINGSNRNITQNIKVDSTAPSITKATFENVSKIERGSVDLEEILDLKNVVTSSTVGDGTLYIRSGAKDGTCEFYFTDTDNDKKQVVGLLRCSKSDVYFYGDTYGDGDLTIETGSLSNNTSIQFTIVKAGSSSSVANLTVKVAD